MKKKLIHTKDIYVHGENNPKGLERILDPKSMDIVSMYYGDERCDIVILEGAYEAEGRMSNFWSWKFINEEGYLGFVESGYGEFYEPIYEYDEPLIIIPRKK